MKKNFVAQCKDVLGKKIDDFIRYNDKYKGKKRILFAKEVNSLLNIESFDEQSDYKKVSRWISGEAFPDLITVMAISKVMGVSIDELFDNNIVLLQKVGQLSIEERKTLKKLISNVNKDNISSVYIPYAFMGKELSFSKEILTREEVVKLYKEKAIRACVLDMLKKVRENESYAKIISSPNAEKHFPRLFSFEFIESAEIELPEEFYKNEDGYIYDTPECIFYNNKDEYYEKISKVWEKYGQDNFFNVIFFDERQFDYNDKDIIEIKDKANYYKTKAYAEKIYDDCFLPLIKKGVLEPIEYDFNGIDNRDFGFDSEDNENIAENIVLGKTLSFFADDEYEYNLQTISLNFKINMSKIEMQEILRGEK